MFKQRSFWAIAVCLAVMMLWLSIGLTACTPATESSPTTADEQTPSVELPAEDSREPDETSNPVVDEESVEEESASENEGESYPVDEETQPETAMNVTDLEGSIDFQTVAQGDSLIAELTTATILVAGSSEEASQFNGLFDDVAISQQIEGVDFGMNWLVLVFSGAAGSSGYGISVEAVQPVDGEVGLHVQQSEPDPDLMVSAVISYPYHMITINKSDLPENSASSWKMYDGEGSLLAEVTYP